MSKYLSDIQAFPQQLTHTYDVDLSYLSQINRVIVCGMGGSALYIPLVHNLLVAHGIDFRLDVASTYTIPPCDPAQTLIICASHSGNTEETLSCLDQARQQGNHIVIFTSGGKLFDAATQYTLPYYLIPTGLQPRLSTGYFLIAMLDVLAQLGLPVDAILTRLQSAALSLGSLVNSDEAADIAKNLIGQVPIVYATDNVFSLALISKIKINENSKMPAFAHYLPEMNHNEMVGWTIPTMKPHFLIALSQYTHPRNTRRVEVMKELLIKRGYPVTIIPLQGPDIETEMLMMYHLMDYVTYYLATAQDIDPEPVAMVEEFKQML